MTALIDTVDMTAASFSAADADVVRVGDSVTVVFDNDNRVTFNGWAGDLQNNLTFSDGSILQALAGGSGNASLIGGAADDLLIGGDGTTVLTGRAGNDQLQGGSGNDQLQGGSGNDTYVFSGSYDHDTIDDSDGVGSIVIDGTTIDGQATLDTATGNWVLKDYPDYYLKPSGTDMELHKTGDSSNTVTIKDFTTGEDKLGNENNFSLLFYSVPANDNELMKWRSAA